MKRLFLPMLLLAALIVSGCEGMSLNGGSPKNVTVTVRISELTPTKTTLGDNQLAVKWQTGDCIGVASKTNVNYCFAIMNESAGQASGVFEGTITGNILSAYYPYSTSAGSDASAAELTMPAIRTSESGTPDMRYGFMVATNAEGSVRKGFSMTMAQKSALLNITVKPNTFLAGAHLHSLKLKVPQRELSGKFKLDLTDIAAPLTFSASSDSIFITLTDSPEMPVGTTVSVPFFLNPAIAAGDSLHITLATDKGDVFIDVKTDKGLTAGARLDYPLDIDALVTAGNATIPAATPIAAGPFADLTVPGVYDVSSIEEITPILTYREGDDQYALYTTGSYSYYRILNLQAGYMLYVSTPKTVTPGASVSLKTDNIGLSHVHASTSQVRCVAVTSQMGWFLDEANHLGYVVLR